MQIFEKFRNLTVIAQISRHHDG